MADSDRGGAEGPSLAAEDSVLGEPKCVGLTGPSGYAGGLMLEGLGQQAFPYQNHVQVQGKRVEGPSEDAEK
ncbi:unnamed protein product [Linum trigynum]|uniref:Uncharacterized protein n=1 Tax=Linum trigynum TaxID=586398 RepID=A0AAV2G4P2_9ROSI